MTNIAETWNRIVAWLQSNAPQVLAQHQDGVGDVELNELEKHNWLYAAGGREAILQIGKRRQSE